MLSLISPAKINLFLRILGKRPDGYHELASLFQAISLADTLHFSLSNHDSLTCTNPTIPLDSSNLIWKAVRLFQLKTNLKFHINIHIEKNIPIQAGLGGGSSNAATTLWALNQLLKTNLPTDILIAWSGEIGSDVPFFLSSGTAYCTGRGEIVKSLPPLSPQAITLVKPSQGLSTPTVYAKLNLSQLPPRDPIQVLDNFYRGAPLYFNDLEEAAFTVLPELALLKDSLVKSGFETVLLSGSGSSFFCLESPSSIIKESCKACFINRCDSNWYE